MHTNGKGIFSNLSFSKLAYGTLHYENSSKYLMKIFNLINMAPLILLCQQKNHVT